MVKYCICNTFHNIIKTPNVFQRKNNESNIIKKSNHSNKQKKKTVTTHLVLGNFFTNFLKITFGENQSNVTLIHNQAGLLSTRKTSNRKKKSIKIINPLATKIEDQSKNDTMLFKQNNK